MKNEIQCPYYIQSHRKNILCERAGDTLNFYVEFDSIEERKTYANKFCCDNWMQCNHAKDMNKFYNY